LPGRIAVVGGGVGGLTVAHRLLGRDPSADVVVLEAAERPGGKLTTVTVGGLELPAGPDSFLARKPWAVELCRELGIGNELVAPTETGAWLWTERGLVPFLADTAFGIPGDVGDVFRWPGLSRAGKWRALGDLVRSKRKDQGDETLGSLLRRRLGDEATDRTVGPLLAGLHAGDVDRLSVRATFPELQAWESSQGSLIRGAQAARRRARQGEPGPMFLRPAAGVQRLTEVLAGRLGDTVRTRATVTRIDPDGAGWVLGLDGGERVRADAVVLAVPAPIARRLLEPLDHGLATELDAIPHVSTGVALMVYPDGTADDLPAGTGFVVPRGRAPMTASTWLSRKWPSEAFGTRAVVRCFVGAAGEEDVLDAADEDIVAACAVHLHALTSLPEAPVDSALIRWPASMPQYELGHLERVARLRERLPAGIVVTGPSYEGVGVPDVVRAADEAAAAAADAVAEHIHEETER